MSHPDQFFDDDGAPVRTCDPVYPDDGQPERECNDAAIQALDVLHHGIIVALAGHRDSTRSRLLALATLAGLFATPSEAARVANVAPSTITRAVKRMREEIRLSANRKPSETPMK